MTRKHCGPNAARLVGLGMLMVVVGLSACSGEQTTSQSSISSTTPVSDDQQSSAIQSVDDTGSLEKSSAGSAVSSPAGPARRSPASSAKTVVAIGDIVCNAEQDKQGCYHRQTLAMTKKQKPQAVLLLGDTQYDAGKPQEYRQSYAPTWGTVKSISYPTPGNHEYKTGGAAGYFDYFGKSAGTRGKGWYSFDIGAWHVVSLNSNCVHVDCSQNSPQVTWLRQDLAAHQSKCVLGFWHQPLFNRGKHGPDPRVRPLYDELYKAGADVVLNGHDHNYQRFAPRDARGNINQRQGIRQFVVGTGGRSLYDVKSGGTEKSSDNTYGVLKMTLHPDGYQWSFLPVAGGTFTDSGSAKCH